MKIIKISTELEMTIHDFPEGTMRKQNKVLCELIGNGCDIVEHVMPKRANLIGSYLYEYDKHGCPILGNILFIGEKMGNSGVDFCGISEENFDRLKKGLVNMFPVIKVTEVKE